MIRKSLLCLLFIHSLVSIPILYRTGLLSVFPPFFELATYQIFSDLVVAESIILLLIFAELRRKQKPLWPLLYCAIGVALFGSFSPLVFLLLNADLFDYPRSR